jgi:hypothetical protein
LAGRNTRGSFNRGSVSGRSQVWLPRVKTYDGIVDRDVCFNWDGSDCNWKVAINVRNCGPFTMFKLFPVPACALRYCGTD